MTRTACTLVLVAGLAGWAGAQVAPPAAATRVRLLHANAQLLEGLLAHGVLVSDAPDSLGRADECRKAVATLAGAMTTAANESDAERVAELADRAAELLESGVAPALGDSRDRVRGGSPGAERLAEVEKDLVRDVAACRAAVAPASRLGGAKPVRAARAHLERAQAAVEPAKGE